MVIPESILVDVGLEILWADTVINAVDTTLYIAPIVYKMIGSKDES